MKDLLLKHVIEDMLNSNINPELLINNKETIYQLNEKLGIKTYKPRTCKYKKLIINIDGTISISLEEWDYK